MKTFTTLPQVALQLGCLTECQVSIALASVDSRTVAPRDLFFALGGGKTDGHAFLKEVKMRGASAAVVRADYHGPDFDLPLLKVPDPLEALGFLAKQALQDSKTHIIGITGSLGKTSTKEFLHTILKSYFPVACTPGNYNSQIGLPLTILNHFQGHEDFLILEMGMTHPGQIARLVQIAPPEVAAITEVALVHACNFESIEGIAAAKAEIFSHPTTKKGIVPEKWLSRIDTHVELKSLESFDLTGVALPILGAHQRRNVQVAGMLACALGLTREQILNVLPHLRLPEKRSEIVEREGVVFVNDSYNAASLSIQAALQTLPSPKQSGRRIAVIGEMMELGRFSEHCHLEVGKVALESVDRLFCLGEGCLPMVDLWRSYNRPVDLFYDRKSLVEALRDEMRDGDVVLLKGANSKQLWKVLEEL